MNSGDDGVSPERRLRSHPRRNGVESDAEAFSAGDAKVKSAYLDSMMSQEVYPLLGYTYAEVKKNEMNLGLDLKGGMNVILEVSVKDVLKGQVANAQDPLFQQTLANTDAAQSAGQNNRQRGRDRDG